MVSNEVILSFLFLGNAFKVLMAFMTSVELQKGWNENRCLTKKTFLPLGETFKVMGACSFGPQWPDVGENR